MMKPAIVVVGMQIFPEASPPPASGSYNRALLLLVARPFIGVAAWEAVRRDGAGGLARQHGARLLAGGQHAHHVRRSAPAAADVRRARKAAAVAAASSAKRKGACVGEMPDFEYNSQTIHLPSVRAATSPYASAIAHLLAQLEQPSRSRRRPRTTGAARGPHGARNVNVTPTTRGCSSASPLRHPVARASPPQRAAGASPRRAVAAAEGDDEARR